MADVVLFHHALGLTPGTVAFADELRGAGHTVRTPDLFDGRTFDTIEEGVGYAQEIGFGEVMARGDRAVEGLPSGLVYAGFSLGVLPAQKLVRTPSPTAPCRRTTPRPLLSYSSGCSTSSARGKPRTAGLTARRADQRVLSRAGRPCPRRRGLARWSYPRRSPHAPAALCAGCGVRSKRAYTDLPTGSGSTPQRLASLATISKPRPLS